MKSISLSVKLSRRRRLTQSEYTLSLSRQFASQSGYSETNEDLGIVEGVWMFIRHGDRTPARPLTPKHRRDEEASFWITKLPAPDSATAFQSFSKFFPVEQEDWCGTTADAFIDLTRNPFGFVTSKGLHQLAESGSHFFNRYKNQRAAVYRQKDIQQSARDFLSVWDVQVYSTNYLRTVMSVQSFLDGMLLSKTCYPPDIDREQRVYDPTRTRELHLADINCLTRAVDEEPLVTIKVRDLRKDPLNAFDRNPELIEELSAEVMTAQDFVQGDSTATTLAARLANILPGLARQDGYTSKTPSRVNWVDAVDHFVCRTAHDISLSQFTDFEKDAHVDVTLQAMSHKTLAHLCWRFRQWYQHNRLLAVIAAPPLREIANQMVQQTTNGPEKRPFVIYSCHDITILGLLYGIAADFLAVSDNESEESGAWRYWPPYGSSLVFELVRIRDGPPTAMSHLVRVLLNGVPVKSLKATTSGMLSIQDFQNIVADLEHAGGHDYESLLGQK